MSLEDRTKPFIWRKKYEEQGIQINDKEIEVEIRKKAEENRVELEKIRERQRKRELEYQQKITDNEFLQRQREAEQHEHWEQQEDEFIIKQQRHRSKIRIRDGRAKTIDLFAHYIDIFGHKPSVKQETGMLIDEEIDLSDSPVELMNPCEWFNSVQQSDLEGLETNINMYMKSDCEQNQQYWKDLLDITRHRLQQAKDSSAAESSSRGDINEAIVADIMELFDGKSVSELDELETEMVGMLRLNDPSVDVVFYEAALSKLRAHRARMRLTQTHRKNLKRQKNKILQKTNADKQQGSTSDVKPGCDNSMDTEVTGDPKAQSESIAGDKAGEDDDDDNQDSDDVDNEYDHIELGLSSLKNKTIMDNFEITRQNAMKEFEEGGYEPKMLRENQIDPTVLCVNYEEEFAVLTQQRNHISNASSLDEAKRATMTSEERAFMDAAKTGMKNDEECVFSCETKVKGPNNRSMIYAWADKYQPRKPRYFNRVHTGFEWNKYNQTHYDIDNPPPKVVQGYKFNIFYPDLIDKSKAPTFSITPCHEDKDFCTIRFSAGPPYEDIAFRIVSREWNNSHKSGYRCQFVHNMLQLWFQFKRYRYRR